MIKVGVFCHSIETFPSTELLANCIDDAIAVIKRQNDEVKFLVSCDPGLGQVFCNELIKQDIAYEVYLSTPPDEYSKYWSEKQQETFSLQLNKARAVHVFGTDNSIETRYQRDRFMIDDSNWVLVFWNGKHQGFTYNATKYAVLNNKIVYNGMHKLTLLDKNTLAPTI